MKAIGKISFIKSLVFATIFRLTTGQIVNAQDLIKVVKMKDQPIVVGEINGKRAYFLIDTGADVTLLHKKDARRYKFTYRETILPGYNLIGLNSHDDDVISIAIDANMYLGNKKIQSCFKVYDLSTVINSIGRSTGVWINGLIGSDLMTKYKFVIDYGRKEVGFTHIPPKAKAPNCL